MRPWGLSFRHHVEIAADIDVPQPAEGFLRILVDEFVRLHRGVVDENVQTSVVLDDRVNHAFPLRGVRNVRLVNERFPAIALYFLEKLIGHCAVGVAVDAALNAGPCQYAHNARTDAFSGSRDESDSIFCLRAVFCAF